MNHYSIKTWVKKKKHLCPVCGCDWDTKTGAKNCCPPEIEFEEIYVCTICEEEHKTKEEAKSCCPTWMCSVCEEEHDDEQEARDCCKVDHE